MPDSTLSQALKEAYAQADQVVFHTIELRHPDFLAPIRVVHGFQSIGAKLEASAPADPGATVSWVAYPFDFSRPEVSPDGVPQITLTIDNVSREIVANLELALGSTNAITITYREYLAESLLVGPQNNPPLTMELLSCSATPFQVTATAGFTNLMNRRFPTVEYSAETFPGLVV